MNANEFIQKNWMGAVLLIIVLGFAYVMFGPVPTVDRTDTSQSFLTGDGTTDIRVEDGSASVGIPSENVQQPAQSGAAGTLTRWCVLIENNHVPDLFGEGIDNGVGGTDWHSYGNDDQKGPQGIVTENGQMIFFVKKYYFDQHGVTPSTVALKASIRGANWTLPLPMTEKNVAGEPAWVYVK